MHSFLSVSLWQYLSSGWTKSHLTNKKIISIEKITPPFCLSVTWQKKTIKKTVRLQLQWLQTKACVFTSSSSCIIVSLWYHGQFWWAFQMGLGQIFCPKTTQERSFPLLWPHMVAAAFLTPLSVSETRRSYVINGVFHFLTWQAQSLAASLQTESAFTLALHL